MNDQTALIRYPIVPIWRRGAALIVDCLPAWVIAALAGDLFLGFLVLFWIVWAGLRVAVVSQQHGQSLGRWAFNLRVAELETGRTPQIQDLIKREAIVGLGAALAVYSLSHLGQNGAWVLLCLPLLGDCCIAFTDATKRQAFHDQIANTIVVKSRRGYGLDHKIPDWLFKSKKRFAEAQRRVK
ncbi:MAG: RDD family protein [Cyanobacteria bacterium J06635_15]